MRVAFVADKSAPFFIGGYESRIWNLARVLTTKHDVHVFTSIPSKELRLNGVTFSKVAPYSFAVRGLTARNAFHSAVYTARLASNVFRGWQPDVVYIEGIPYAHLVSMTPWIRRIQSRILLNVNEAWSEFRSSPGAKGAIETGLVKKALNFGLSWADEVIAISATTASSLSNYYGAKSVTLLPMGVNLSSLPATRYNSRRARPVDFVTVGRQVGIKRTVDFIDALAMLKRKHSWRGRAVVVGAGPELTFLRKRTSMSGLSELVSLPGMISEAEKLELLSKSCFYVLCSEREGFSVGTLEAMACGSIPIVARPSHTEVFGVSEIVTPSVTGYSYPVGNVVELASQMNLALLSSEEIERVRVRATAVADQYDWTRIGQRLDRLISVG